MPAIWVSKIVPINSYLKPTLYFNIFLSSVEKRKPHKRFLLLTVSLLGPLSVWSQLSKQYKQEWKRNLPVVFRLLNWLSLTLEAFHLTSFCVYGIS